MMVLFSCSRLNFYCCLFRSILTRRANDIHCNAVYITGAGSQKSNFPVVLGLAVVIAISMLIPAAP